MISKISLFCLLALLLSFSHIPNMPTCFVCKQTFDAVKQITLHFSISHGLNYNSTHFECGEPGCVQKPLTYLFNLKDHYYNVHKFRKDVAENAQFQSKVKKMKFSTSESHTEDILSNSVSENQYVPSTSSSNSEFPISNSGNPAPFQEITNSTEEIKSISEIKEFNKTKTISYMSTLYANPSFPRNCVQSMIRYTTSLFSDLMSGLKDKISAVSGNLSKDELDELNEAFLVTQNPFEGFETEHKRMTFFKELGTFIEPVPYDVGFARISCCQVTTEFWFFWVPLKYE